MPENNVQIANEADVQLLLENGRAGGDIATLLLKSGMDTGWCRPYINKKDGKAYVTVQNRKKPVQVVNAVLLHEEWEQISNIVTEEAQYRLQAVADLESRGLVEMTGGLGKTVLHYQTESDVEDAEVSMDGINEGRRDRPEYASNYLPLPIFSKQFSFSLRDLSASRNGSQSLDMSGVRLATRKVAELTEKHLIGVSATQGYTFGGGTLYGYMSHPYRNTVSLSTNWDASAKTAAQILADVINMKKALQTDKHFGPYVLYIPTAYETVLDNNYSTSYSQTLRQRILAIAGIQDVKTLDFLTANNVLMVSLDPATVVLAKGLPIQVIQWDSHGGMRVNFLVLTIMVPKIQATYGQTCGVAHLS